MLHTNGQISSTCIRITCPLKTKSALLTVGLDQLVRLVARTAIVDGPQSAPLRRPIRSLTVGFELCGD